jgi:hypothetical protein
MAELSRFLGIVVSVFTRGEIGKHNTPHVHVFTSGNSASIAIDGGRVLAGRLRPSDLWLVRYWMKQHKADLHEAWSAATAGKKPRRILPLKGSR